VASKYTLTDVKLYVLLEKHDVDF